MFSCSCPLGATSWVGGTSSTIHCAHCLPRPRFSRGYITRDQRCSHPRRQDSCASLRLLGGRLSAVSVAPPLGLRVFVLRAVLWGRMAARRCGHRRPPCTAVCPLVWDSLSALPGPGLVDGSASRPRRSAASRAFDAACRRSDCCASSVRPSRAARWRVGMVNAMVSTCTRTEPASSGALETVRGGRSAVWGL
jgi:hypothetical protein